MLMKISFFSIKLFKKNDKKGNIPSKNTSFSIYYVFFSLFCFDCTIEFDDLRSFFVHFSHVCIVFVVSWLVLAARIACVVV